MGRSLSLSAYLAYARGVSLKSPVENSAKRPPGGLIWAHAVDRAKADALCQLAERMIRQHSNLHMVLTRPGNVEAPPNIPDMVTSRVLPEDNIANAKTFLGHWAPDICLWTGGQLQAAFLICADEAGIPLYLIDAEAQYLAKTSWRLFSDVPRDLLGRFERILAREDSDARLIKRLARREIDIRVSGPFEKGALALPCDDDERDMLAAVLRGRPVWLAANLMLDELDVILTAHRNVMRLAHRTFLILSPGHMADIPTMRSRLERDGWRYSLRSDSTRQPEETTQILLADTEGEMGLWFRLAGTSFMGSSLIDGAGGSDPNEPAALGSAILYGPHMHHYRLRYTRYTEAGAAREVRDTATLAAAVEHLIAPNISAVMAHAAWDAASQGADLADQVLDLVQDVLDQSEARK